MQKLTIVPAPFGSVGLVVTPAGLSDLVMTGRKAADARRWLRRRFPDAVPTPDLLPSLQRQLQAYVAGRPVTFRARLDLDGLTPFQRQVLAACAKLAYGQTVTYGQLAQRIGRPRAARAVGGALGRNPVPLVVPCHRVVAGNGSLGGFSAEQGVSLKRRLLDLEAGCPWK